MSRDNNNISYFDLLDSDKQEVCKDYARRMVKFQGTRNKYSSYEYHKEEEAKRLFSRAQWEEEQRAQREAERRPITITVEAGAVAYFGTTTNNGTGGHGANHSGSGNIVSPPRGVKRASSHEVDEERPTKYSKIVIDLQAQLKEAKETIARLEEQKAILQEESRLDSESSYGLMRENDFLKKTIQAQFDNGVAAQEENDRSAALAQTREEQLLAVILLLLMTTAA